MLRDLLNVYLQLLHIQASQPTCGSAGAALMQPTPDIIV
jgi:hypothetical protein